MHASLVETSGTGRSRAAVWWRRTAFRNSDQLDPRNQFRGVSAITAEHAPLIKFSVKRWLNLVT